ncbi:MAG: MerR family transcriptional regulator [Pseudomonadota bacterium]
MKQQWYVKELSKLTGVTVQTLHHYDHIDLLKPSIRLSNGYRLYSEADLLKLQQIIALKFFGFQLAQIKEMLAGRIDVNAHLKDQSRLLEEKAKKFSDASRKLKEILHECGSNQSVPWESTLKLIEVYYMTQQLEQEWLGRVLTPNELKQYAVFDSKRTDEERSDFGRKWDDIERKILANHHENPRSEIGLQIAKDAMALVNGRYGDEHANLKHAIWQAYKNGQVECEGAFDPRAVEWLDNACDHYYRGRIYALLDQVESCADLKSEDQLLIQWKALLREMYGGHKHLELELIEAAIADERVGPETKQWLNQFMSGL